MKLEHFYSDGPVFGNRSDKPFHKEPSQETIRQAITLGRVAVGDADIIATDSHDGKKLLTVVMRISNGLGGNVYRDMYRVL